MNFTGGTGTQPKVVKKICIREYVAEVRKTDWKKCCPFNLWGDSEESNHQAERVYMSLFLQKDDHLFDFYETTAAPNFARASEVGNHEVQAAVQETNTDTMNQPSIEVNDSDGRIEEIVPEEYVRLLKTTKQKRNPVGQEPKKLRTLSEIYKELDVSGDDVSSDDNPSCGRSSESSSKQTAPAPPSLIYKGNICESPRSSDDDMMAADILFRMSNGDVQTKTLSKTAVEEEAVSKAKGKDPREDDGHVTPTVGYGLPENITTMMPVCVMNGNPSELKTEEARKFRREC